MSLSVTTVLRLVIIIIAHAVTLPAYAITTPLLPRGAIDHRGCAATVCGGSQPASPPASQPASQRLNLQIYGGILLRPDFCGIRRSRSRWHPPCIAVAVEGRGESWTMLYARPKPRTRSHLVGEPNSATPDVPQTARRRGI